MSGGPVCVMYETRGAGDVRLLGQGGLMLPCMGIVPATDLLLSNKGLISSVKVPQLACTSCDRVLLTTTRMSWWWRLIDNLSCSLVARICRRYTSFVTGHIALVS